MLRNQSEEETLAELDVRAGACLAGPRDVPVGINKPQEYRSPEAILVAGCRIEKI